MKLWIEAFFSSLAVRTKILWYINGPQTLPPPLSEKEEQYIFENWESKDRTIKEKMIVHNLRLVIYIAKKFENSAVSVEDLTSIGSLGLIKAVNSFKPSKNIKFATYASRCVENEILMFLRKHSNRNTDISIDDALSVDSDGNELNLIDILYTDEYEVSRDMEKESERQILWQSIHSLSERERQIILMRFGLGGCAEKTQKEVADEIGISQSYISRLEKRIFKKLKKEIERTV
ncbi:MAG: sigma-70 family RNA polymerase sigma factor [Oscillospiraceae bacterium]|nr:sigma-70 family RNA polymerase sigma factor [Oscillospiraceae bacterium]